jgi:hypothetical protein
MTRRRPWQSALARLLPPRTKQYEGVRFLLHHLVGGVLGAVVFMGLILAFDLAGLRGLILESEHGVLAGLLLLFGLVITFGSVAMAAAIMLQGEDKN